jgi:nucleoside-diphosphate-sugar epimerase
MTKPTVLLTGATGFLGSHLLEALIQQDYSVVILKRSTSNLWRIEHLVGYYKSYDIDIHAIELVFKEQRIDVVVHLATLYKKFEESKDVSEMLSSNVTFPSELVVEAVNYGVKGFINTGTFFEYDCSIQPVSELAETKAFNFYAKTKLAFETILKTYSDQLSVNTFKLFSPFGEKDNPKLIHLIVKNAIKNEPLNLSEGLQKIDLIYAKDIVNAYIKSIERMVSTSFKPEFEVFNLGSGSPLSIRDILSLVEEELGKRLEVNWGESSKNDAPIVYADTKKIKNLLQWQQTYGVRLGIKNTIEYFKG